MTNGIINIPAIVKQKLKGARPMRCANSEALARNSRYNKKWSELTDYIVVRSGVPVVHPYPDKGEDRVRYGDWLSETWGTLAYETKKNAYTAEAEHISPYCDAMRPALNWIYDKHFKKEECYLVEDRWSRSDATITFWFFHADRAADAEEMVALGGAYA